MGEVIDLNETVTLSRVAGSLTPIAEQFEALDMDSSELEAAAWNTVRDWHEPEPVQREGPLVSLRAVKKLTAEICRLYGVASVTESILAYLYLKHRALFLTYQWNFYADSNGNYSRSYQPGSGGRWVSGYSYSGCSACTGDIVDFHGLAMSKVLFPRYFPGGETWKQLQADHQLPLGLINYEKIADIVRGEACAHIKRRWRERSLYAAKGHLVELTRLFERRPMSMEYPIALVVHAVAMPAMCT